MPRKRIQMILEIHDACTKPLYSVLKGITEPQLNWNPADDSRSVNQIMCHLIRVDNYFLQRLNQQVIVKDPKNRTVSEILDALINVHVQIKTLLQKCPDDEALFTKSPYEKAEKSDTINEHILHSCQHNLYHLSQMIYLRRALDRNWEPPVAEWDKATRIIAGYLSADNDKQ